MTNLELSRLKVVVEDREFCGAIEAALAEEAGGRIQDLKTAVRAGNLQDAARICAEIDTLEDVVKVLERYAAQYRKDG